MEAIEIYKKFPRTNCGKCGEATCIAFAMKVSKSQARSTDCPFFIGDAGHDSQPDPPSATFSSYEQVGREIEKEAVEADFREAAEAIGGTYESGPGGKAIRLKMMNRIYELRKDGLFRDNAYCRDPWAKIIICDYVRRKGCGPLTGEWISLGHFPRTASHVKAFQRNAEKKLADHFKDDLDGLKRRCAEIGGAEAENRVKADFSCLFDLLPHVPLSLSFWAADEEFDAECKLLFDRGAESHIDIEYLAYLLEQFVEELTEEGTSTRAEKAS